MYTFRKQKTNFPAKYSLLKLSTLTDKGIGHWGIRDENGRRQPRGYRLRKQGSKYSS
jgi:hypothetical protein